MKHDPERDAAAYLGGHLSRRRRRMFEQHIVECEDCWQEVQLGGEGRTVAESGRELAPQVLRERVRAAVESITPHRRRPVWLFAAGTVAAIAVVLAVAHFAVSRQPQEIEAVLTSFRTAGSIGHSTPPELPARLGKLTLAEAEQGQVESLDVVAHRYADPSGDMVVVYMADKRWPVAVGARHDNAGEAWIAEKDGLVLICLNDPAPLLIVGHDVHDVELAAYTLRPDRPRVLFLRADAPPIGPGAAPLMASLSLWS